MAIACPEKENGLSFLVSDAARIWWETHEAKPVRFGGETTLVEDFEAELGNVAPHRIEIVLDSSNPDACEVGAGMIRPNLWRIQHLEDFFEITRVNL
jgi:hypothetical protein